MKHFCLLTLLLTAFNLSAQTIPTLSDQARVSMITVAPGEALYSSFGHSALRIFDPVNRIDRCYNYGTFNFDQPNFYLNFCRGKLLYSLDLEPYRGFEYGNLADRRQMQEQVLNLNGERRQQMFNLLQTNALPENRDYKYEFFYDNCATRIRDMVKETFFHQIYFDSTAIPYGQTMRQLLRPYLVEKAWVQFGMDLCLGAAADRKALAEDFMFLPDHMHNMFAKTKIDNGAPLVLSERVIPEAPFSRPAYSAGFFGRPLWVMSFIALLGLLCMANPRTERIFDTFFWFVLGASGLLFTLLWFATDHASTKNNANILWALPTHLLFFWRRTRSEFTENYFTGAAILAALTLIFWKFIPQEMPVAAIPVVVLVVVKGLWRRYWKAEK